MHQLVDEAHIALAVSPPPRIHLYLSVMPFFLGEIMYLS